MIKKGDFVQISYTAKEYETGHVFDTTDKDIALKAGLNPRATYKPIIICVGEGDVIPGLDDALVGKKPLETLNLRLEPEHAFGKKQANLIERIQSGKFTKEGINPQVGMPVTVNGKQGYIIASGAGRTLVDFNHPLANKVVQYSVVIHQIVQDTQKQVESVVDKLRMNATATLEGTNVIITTPVQLPDFFKEVIEKQLKKLIPVVSSVTLNHAKPTSN
jgi:FKBP-type peptidyl-prolyl cis-trans isomerase 2